jgi:predicted lipoprotein with Yx(FWY)xxD motif
MSRIFLILAIAAAAIAVGTTETASGEAEPGRATAMSLGQTEPARGAAAVSLAGGESAARATVRAGGSRFGRILFDGRGFVLYGFTRDRRGRSLCARACARAWPPYVVARKPAAGAGVKAKLLGTTRRPDGRLQATYAGKPLYYYVSDRKPGQILCQNVREFGGLWLVVRPSGGLVR